MMMKGRTVNVTAEDALAAATTSTMQMLRKISNGRNRDHGGKSKRGLCTRWANTMNGLMAEISLSRVLNVAWTGVGRLVSHGDVGGTIEVRATDYETGHLTIYHEDEDDHLGVLLIGSYPAFRIAGCMRCGDAKRDEWWKADADPPCFWVPQSVLGDFDY